ncbi:MAG: ParB/RepB/Spo0J family partition protein [Bacteroidales bacterium]|nr:ParB/RepB/Spo0J family partition protein [Bacteroidales bacterium]
MSAKKRALGRGLGALLEGSGIEPQAVYSVEKDLLPTGSIGKLPVDLIEVNPFQPRTDFDEEALNDLAVSIKEQGVIQPITVRKADNDKLQLIAGERRLKAAKMAGLTDIPAYIISADDGAMLEMAIVENIQRENLNPIETALGYKQLVETFKLTQEMLSERLGKSRSYITNMLRLLKLPAEIQIGLRQESISTGHAKALLALDDPKAQMEVFQKIVTDELSVRQTENIIKSVTENSTDGLPQKKTQSKKPGHPALQRDLEALYNTSIRIKSGTRGKGSIIIRYKTEDELHRLSKLLKR